MSRRVTDSSRILVLPANSSITWSWFFWLKMDDAFPGGTNAMICRTGDPDTVAFGSTSTPDWYMQVNWGGFTRAADTDTRDGVWLPVMITNDGDNVTLDVGDLPRVTNTANSAMPLSGGFRHNDSASADRPKNFAEAALWSTLISRAEYDAMTDTGAGDTPNPSLTQPGSLITYLSMNTANLQTEAGSEALLWSDEGGAHDVSHPPVTQLASGSMVFVDPSPLDFRVGQTLTNYDTAAWFSGYSGTLSVTFDVLPSGVIATGNLLNGTIDASGTVTTQATGSDSDWPGGDVIGSAEWRITPYTIPFVDVLRLEDDANAPINTANVVASLLEGTVTDDLTAVTPIHSGPYTITNGELTITLPDTEFPGKQYQVLLEDTDETNTPLGIYDRSSI